MKKFILFFLFVTTVSASIAQNINNNAALALVEKNLGSIGLSKADLNNSIVSNAYFSAISGAQIIYLQQSYQGIPVFNQLQTLAFKNGELVSKTGERISNIEKRVQQSNAIADVSPISAIKAAMINKNIISQEQLLRIAETGNKKINFEKINATKEKITAELMWVPLNEGKELKLAWQINLSPSATADNWLIRVSASDNKIIGETNLTVYCNFDKTDDDKPHELDNETIAKNKLQRVEGISPLIVNGASYRVVPYPAESPIHQGGSPALQSNPWSLSTGNAVSLKWHSDGTNDYNYTRGNNAWAYHDRANNNTADLSKSAASTTSPDPLTFDFVPDFTLTPTETTPVQNQQFNITNLFYWNNIIHDLTYQYGFDEAAGNFQANNQGRGGLGNDYVLAEAQDGGSTNNANFNSPADGGRGRMQMYLWSGTPQKDGDADNGIIVHEFSHGLSGRLTGGPAQAGCLGNDEQMGEGWSDYYALMATQNWATAALSDGFNNPRGIGTYANGQPITGVGIRPRRYTTNMAMNEMTYSNLPTQVIPHGVGFVWCTMLWDMTWEIIQQAGINPNLFNAAGTGGNTIALKLVTEAMKLQPCSPGFIDGRNAILQADQLLYGGQYRCAIVNAFARRGLGFDASQGSSGSRSDGVAGFSIVESNLKLTQNITQQLEGQNIIYTNKVSAGICIGLTNYLLTDTLPANVTYVSGGSYASASRVVSFTVNLAAGQTQNYSFTVQVNNGSWFPTATLLDEQILTNSIPSNWSISSIDATNFTVSSTKSHSTPHAFFGVNSTTASDFRIATNLPVAIGSTPTFLSFWHNFDTEDGWDGGMVEISTDAGTSWTDLGPNMIVNGYNGSMGSGSNNPLAGRAAFTGNSNGFIKTTISLSPFANKNALIRFRAASDDNTAIAGWYIDDILIQNKALVNMRSSLFNGSGNRLSLSDTSTIILENALCSNGVITTQPNNITACEGSNISFLVNTTGTALTYQWQVSTNGGVSYNNILGATTASLDLAAITAAFNNNKYRIIITGPCTVALISNDATLTINAPILINTQPGGAAGCIGSNVSFSIQSSGPSLTYQWQVSKSGGSFTNVNNSTLYSGVNTNTLKLLDIKPDLNGDAYRVIVSGSFCTSVISSPALLEVYPLTVALINAAAFIKITPSLPTTLTSIITPAGSYFYKWHKDNIAIIGATGKSYMVDIDKLGSYHVVVTDKNGCTATSNLINVSDSASDLLFIYPNPNKGLFQVRFYSTANNASSRTLIIFDGMGKKVFSNLYTIASTYQRMDVNLFNMNSGVYFVELRETTGKRLATGKIIVQ